jgi:hypothetical protein
MSVVVDNLPRLQLFYLTRYWGVGHREGFHPVRSVGVMGDRRLRIPRL